MARTKKKPRRQPSIISSELDRRFSPTYEPPDSESTDVTSDSSATATPASVNRKQAHPKSAQSTQSSATTITYILALFSAADMKQAVSKRRPKNGSLQLSLEKPWDTLKAQLLAKIDTLLKPKTISYEDYKVMFYIPRVVPKPGISLTTDTDYTLLLECVRKNALVHLNITSRISDNDKENELDKLPGRGQKKKTKKDPALLPGNVKKAANIQALKEHWKCEKKVAGCLGVFCFINQERDIHMPLSHQQLDCWALAMVCSFFFLSIVLTECSIILAQG
jgi:hypothetical protein